MPEPLSKIPAGMRYHFGSEARLRRSIEDAAMTVFAGWCYEEIATPAVDYYSLFERGMGHGEAHRAFRFADTDGRMLALRPDVTSAVARAAATLFAARPRPLRFCYAASVFRQSPRSQADWRRQGRQLGCELIGAAGAEADMEVLAIAVEVLERLGLRRGEFRFTLSHAGVFHGVAEQLGLGDEAREQARLLVDTRDAAGLEDFIARNSPAGADAAALAGRLARLSGGREALDGARVVMTGARAAGALASLENVWGVVESLGLADDFRVDLGDVSGLDYYTGLVFKIYAAGAGARVGSGGRYDELTASFGGREPATGFVLDLDALTDVLARGGGGSAPAGDDRAPAFEVAAAEPAAMFREARERRARGERVRMEVGGGAC